MTNYDICIAALMAKESEDGNAKHQTNDPKKIEVKTENP